MKKYNILQKTKPIKTIKQSRDNDIAANIWAPKNPPSEMKQNKKQAKKKTQKL